MRLTHDFFARPTLLVAEELLGSILTFAGPHGRRRGIITETEAYHGLDDRASHASRGRTPRTELMFGPPGYAYVYLVYGMHHCLNIVTEPAGNPAAVLIRALAPREPATDLTHTTGPGRVSRWLGITRTENGIDATGDILYIEKDQPVRKHEIITGPRIGVSYAGEWAAKPWRFRIKDGTSI